MNTSARRVCLPGGWHTRATMLCTWGVHASELRVPTEWAHSNFRLSSRQTDLTAPGPLRQRGYRSNKLRLESTRCFDNKRLPLVARLFLHNRLSSPRPDPRRGGSLGSSEPLAPEMVCTRNVHTSESVVPTEWAHSCSASVCTHANTNRRRSHQESTRAMRHVRKEPRERESERSMDRYPNDSMYICMLTRSIDHAQRAVLHA